MLALKTRNVETIAKEVVAFLEVHRRLGSHAGGLHLEATALRVTECVGGSARGKFSMEFADCSESFEGVEEKDVGKRYLSACDPRLNDLQSLEMAHTFASVLAGNRK